MKEGETIKKLFWISLQSNYLTIYLCNSLFLFLYASFRTFVRIYRLALIEGCALMRMFIFLVIWVGILQLFKVDAAAVKYGLACTMRSLCNGQTVEEQKQLPETRLIAIGDIHGSYTGLLEDLYDANITTSRDICMWQSQPIHTILVQSGDLVDRGPGALESLKCLQNLQNTAKDFNGEVVRILGSKTPSDLS